MFQSALMYVAIQSALNNLLMVTIAFAMRSQLKENEQFPNKLTIRYLI